MKGLLRKYWMWYEDLKEPYRMFMAFLMMSPIFIFQFVYSNEIEMPWRFLLVGLVLLPFGFLLTRWWSLS